MDHARHGTAIRQCMDVGAIMRQESPTGALDPQRCEAMCDCQKLDDKNLHTCPSSMNLSVVSNT